MWRSEENSLEECPFCDGTGVIPSGERGIDEICPVCDGEGVIYNEE